jgi:hypothetical protein
MFLAGVPNCRAGSSAVRISNLTEGVEVLTGYLTYIDQISMTHLEKCFPINKSR